MYSKARPIMVNFGKINGGGKTIVTNAETRKELTNALMNDREIANANPNWSVLMIQFNGDATWEKLPFFANGKGENDFKEMVSKSGNSYKDSNGKLNWAESSDDWIMVSIIESEKVSTSGLPEFENLTKKELINLINSEGLATKYISSMGVIAESDSRDNMLSFLFSEKFSQMTKGNAGDRKDSSRDSLLEEIGALKGENKYLKEEIERLRSFSGLSQKSDTSSLEIQID